MALPTVQLPYHRVYNYDVIMSDVQRTGVSFRRHRHPHNIKGHVLEFWPLNSTERGDLQTTFRTAKGSATTFSFTPPGGSAVNVRFADDTLEIRAEANGVWRSTVHLVEEVV